SGGFGPALVLEPPTSMEFSSESGAVLPCSARGQPTPRITWERKDGSPAAPVDGLRSVRSDGSLVLSSFLASQYRQDVHSATYRCVASNPLGTVKSRLVHVQGVVLQKFTANVYDVYVIRGNSALLRCYVPPAVKDYVRVTSWVRDDGVTVGTLGSTGIEDRYLMLPTGELLIRDVQSPDTFRGYRCQVRNVLTGGTDTSATAGKVIVTEPHTQTPPRMAEYRSVVQVEQGDQAFLPCLAQGNPPPTQTWYRLHGPASSSSSTGLGNPTKGLRRSSSPVVPSERLTLLEGALVLHGARTQDEGKYACVVNNSAGEDRADTDLVVTVPLSAHLEPSVQTVDVGRTANLSCRVAGHPVHGVQWTLNGRPLAKGDPRFTLLSRDLLQVSSVQRDDRGMYQCLAFNQRDSAQGTAQLVIGEDAPVLEQVFSEQEVRPGTSMSLKCSASGNPLPQVTWTLDGGAVPEVYHIRIGDYVSNERIVHSYVNLTSVRVEDGGRYACVARNGVGAAQHSARLNVLGRPLVRPMGNVTALAGRPVTLHCPVAGHPIRSIAWLKDGRSLPQNHRQRTFPNGTLVISDVQRSVDSGWYSCVAQDPDGNSAKRQVALDVMIPPVVNPFAFPSDLTEGKRAGAACIVSDGDLPISVEWRKDGLPLAPALRASVAEANDYTSFLSFAAVRQSHSGNYTCVASNPAASANFTAPMIVQVPPRWRQEPRDMSAVMGQAVVFDCQADGFPVPVIRWKKAHGDSGGRDFSVIISNANVQILENGSLSIREADRKDGGQYMCQAINGVGPGISTVVRLDIHVAAHFERKFQALTVRRGESIALTCSVVGEPPITVTWTRDRHGFNPTLEPRYVVEEKPGAEDLEYTVHIPAADRRDSSLFSCYAENAYGRDDTNFQVVVQEPPDKPRGLETTSTTSRAATLVWAPPYSGNSPVLKYLLEYKTEPGSWDTDKHLVAVDSTDLSHVVNALKPKSTYEFRLRAENALGVSDYSDSLVLTTDEEAPSGAPRAIKVTATGSRSLRVVWKPPTEEETHGAVHGYYVGYRVRESKESYAYKTLEASTAAAGHGFTASSSSLHECELTDLRKNTRYSVVVQAFNAKGAGPSSEEVLAQTLEIDPPNAPSLKLVSSTSSSVHLSWEAAKEQPVSGYVLYQRAEATPGSSSLSSESAGEWSEIQMSADRSAYAFRGLDCGRRYAFYALAFNAAGRGPQSNTVFAKTEGSAPVAPELQDLVSLNITAVTLQLSSWKSGGCPIAYFVVLYKQQAAREWTPAAARLPAPAQQHPPQSTTLVIGDLSPATWYDLLVTAHNEAGSTEAVYAFATLTLDGGTVSPPRLTQAVDSQQRQIRIIVPVV
ncbi:Down syndrome cell adhesion molecule homolog, partial [Ixodes scapularis]